MRVFGDDGMDRRREADRSLFFGCVPDWSFPGVVGEAGCAGDDFSALRLAPLERRRGESPMINLNNEGGA
ncbi:MAG TPA: hypothetical protein VNT79_10110 [Phycisphaerae bacterium]|nr:hypothetical protein [Phycisphaerae bacterium]